uniref:Uncharacterized protein n=1 Tax=Rhizophora mucronata TaxID=61149 RepID=A0A2P2PLH8_RHIMU
MHISLLEFFKLLPTYIARTVISCPVFLCSDLIALFSLSSVFVILQTSKFIFYQRNPSSGLIFQFNSFTRSFSSCQV